MRKLGMTLFAVMLFSVLAGWGVQGQKSPGKADQSKYGKYFISKDIWKIVPEGYTGTSLFAHEGELKADVSMGYHCVTKPILFDKTHAHNNAEILCFIGGDPREIPSLGAEVEVSLGPELEKHIITQTTCVSIPANLPHCPVNIKKVDKPIVFLEISLAPKYKAAEIGGK